MDWVAAILEVSKVVSHALEKERLRKQIRKLEDIIGRCQTMVASNNTLGASLNSLGGVLEAQIQLSGIDSVKTELRNLNSSIADNISAVSQACTLKKNALEQQINHLVGLELQSAQNDS